MSVTVQFFHIEIEPILKHNSKPRKL